MSTQLP